jgi:hypothetical protein
MAGPLQRSHGRNMSDGLFPRPLPDGRRLYARSLFYREGNLRRAPWILPGAPDTSWYEWMNATVQFLRHSHIERISTDVPNPHMTVHYTQEWASMGDANGHEYRLMTPAQAKAENEAPGRP